MKINRFIKALFLSSILTLSSCSFFNGFSGNSFTVTWKNDDGTVLEVDENVKKGEMPSYDSEKPTKDEDERASYTFKGWSPELAPVTKDITYTAAYDSNPFYYIYFSLDGGTSPSYVPSVKVHEFTLSVFFYDVYKEDYRFRGWMLNNERVITENGELLKEIVMDSDLTFKACFMQDLAVDFVVKDAEMSLGVEEISEDGSYNYYETINLHIALKEGYEFVGWYVNNELISSNEDDTYTLGNFDIEIEARIKYRAYEVEAKSYNTSLGVVNIDDSYAGHSRETKDVEYKSEVTLHAVKMQTYAFLGWFDSDNKLISSEEDYTFVMPNHNVSLTAKWDLFMVSYHLNGGTNSENNPTSISSGDVISLEDATMEDYEFTGWEVNGEKVTSLDGSNLENITLEATFTPIKYQINYHLYGGTNNVDNPEKYSIEDNTITFKDPSHNDMYFAGWYLDEDFTQPVTSINPYEEKKDIDIYAKWVVSFDEFISNLRFTIENDEARVVGIYDKSVQEIRVPSILTTPTRDCPVVGISSGVFSCCSNLVKISLPFVGDAYHSSISEEQYPLGYIFGQEEYEGSSLVYQIQRKYYNDYELENYYIPTSLKEVNVTNSSYLPLGSFSNLKTLTSITINKGLEVIGEKAFYRCSISEITLPHSLSIISIAAFEEVGPIKTLEIFENITEIRESAFLASGIETFIFANANKLTSIGGSNTYACGIGKSAQIYIHINTDKWLSLLGKDADIYTFNAEYHLFLDGSNSAASSLTIPSEITELPDAAFKACPDLTSIDLNNVQVIGKYAFACCYNLASINLDNNITHIKSNAFAGCNSLVSITLANTLLDIEMQAFSGCSNLQSVTFEETPSITHIGESAFSGCSKLTLFTIPASIKKLDSNVFAGDENISELVIPEGVEYSDSIFGAMRLKKITVPTYVSSIWDNIGALEEITFTSKTSLPNGAFRGAEKLKKVTFLAGCDNIGEGAFEGCTALETITIPEGVSKIEKNTFLNCSNLTSISFSDTVKEIDSTAFTGCSSLAFNEDNNGIYLPSNGNAHFVFMGVIDNSVSSLTINTSTRIVVKGAIKDCANLENLVTPFVGSSRHTEEDDNQYPLGYMFDCSINYVNVNQMYYGENHQLTFKTFNIPKGLKEIFVNDSPLVSYGAFYNCTRLEKVSFTCVRTLGGSVFYNCQNLKTVNMSEHLENIGSSVFYNCTSLRKIDIPKSVTTLGDWCFYNCQYLYEVNFKSGTQITDLGNNTFANCNENIDINFYGASNVWHNIKNKKSLIGNVHYFDSEGNEVYSINIDEVGDYEYARWTSLYEVTVSEGVTSIGYLAFEGCMNLSSLTIPSSVTSIENYAFLGCISLVNIYYSGTMEQWSQVKLGFDWNYDGTIVSIACSDGVIYF